MQAITENVFDAVRQVLPNSPLQTLQGSIINSQSENKTRPKKTQGLYETFLKFLFKQ